MKSLTECEKALATYSSGPIILVAGRDAVAHAKALLEAGETLFKHAGHAYACPVTMGLPCVCGFQGMIEKWIKASAQASDDFIAHNNPSGEEKA